MECSTRQALKLPALHWRQAQFRLHHISTDEVFGSLGATGRFSETTPYDPRSPSSASQAASDHLVNAWHHTYGLPVVLTNCSNYYVGGSGSNGTASERTNRQVAARPGHDRRYAIDPSRISRELGWQPRHSFERGLAATVRWYLEQPGWCSRVRERAGYSGGRLGVLAEGA